MVLCRIQKGFFILSVLLFFSSCAEEKKEKSQTIDCSAISKLESDQQKIEFLTGIWEIDQGIRSPEVNTPGKEMNRLDEMNLLKIECYLQHFEYPKPSFGYEANSAPWAVIHHSYTAEDRRRNFKSLYKAYLNDHLEEGHFAFFLDRLYKMENGSRYDMKSPYKESDRIEELIEALELK